MPRAPQPPKNSNFAAVEGCVYHPDNPSLWYYVVTRTSGAQGIAFLMMKVSELRTADSVAQWAYQNAISNPVHGTQPDGSTEYRWSLAGFQEASFETTVHVLGRP
ncbi:hypothetical protein TWF718_009690 [Orbilia javanica]|uniref:Uncharacterized protein n=1 Tax=Orbilia javanica TaxID=47235 RepID=A0AAN8MSX0_9PEZI